MKVLIFGGSGMLGHMLVQVLEDKFEVNYTIRGDFSTIERFGIFDRANTVERMSVEDPASVRNAVEAVGPDVVINAVGVIKQVQAAGNAVETISINSLFPHRLAELGREFGFRLISVSTDCVFDGKRGNYSEVDQPNATDLYGKSKYLGEVTGENCLTVRTSIIGRELSTKHSMVEWALSNRGKQINGYVNAIYSGFPTIEFADIITSLIEQHPDLSGLYHIASAPINKYELLSKINKAYDAEIAIEPFSEFKIDRSLNGELFNTVTGFRPKSWDEMIENMASDTTPYENWNK